MKKEDIPELSLTDVVTKAQVTMVCDHLGARRLDTRQVIFPRPTSSVGFTPFSSLTESEVQTWIENAMGADAVTALHEELKAECDTIVNGASGTVTTPPWITPGAQ